MEVGAITADGSSWEIGDLPPGPNAYIKLPLYEAVKVTARHGDGTYRSAKQPTATYSSQYVQPTRCEFGAEARRARHERQHRPGNAWRSLIYPRLADHRTVDELGLPIQQLDNERSPRTLNTKAMAEAAVDAMFVEGAALHREGKDLLADTILLSEGKKAVGDLKPVAKKAHTQYAFYKITVPDRDVPVGLHVSVSTVFGDPDIFVCNRMPNPMQQPHEHTWSSMGAGDDQILISPDDPNFLPGAFYISVFSIRETRFEITARFVEQEVRMKAPMPAEGNGYREVKAHLVQADTRRRFCKNGLGFKTQLDSPRSLHGSAAPPPSPRPASSRPTSSRPGAAEGARAPHRAPLAPKRPATAHPTYGGARASPRLTKALSGAPTAAAGSATGFAAALAAHGAPSLEDLGNDAAAMGAPPPPPPPPSSAPVAHASSRPASQFVPGALPQATRDELMARTMRAATPRGRPSTLWERTQGGGEGGGAQWRDSYVCGGEAMPTEPAAAAGDSADLVESGGGGGGVGGTPRPTTPRPTTPRSARGSGGGGGGDPLRASHSPRPATAPLTAPRSTRLAARFADTAAIGGAPGGRPQSSREGQGGRLAMGQPTSRGGGGCGSTSGGGGAGGGGGGGGAYSARLSREARSSRERRSPSPTSGLGRRSPIRGDEAHTLSESQKLERFDADGADALATVREYLAYQHHISSEVIEHRSQIPVTERISLAKGEFRGVQNLLTMRLRKTLDAQDAARLSAYRFRAKASQHLEVDAATNWSPQRALALLTTESLKIKSDYDTNVAAHRNAIKQRQEEARSARERTAARLRIRAAFGSAQAGVRMLRLARGGGGGGGGSAHAAHPPAKRAERLSSSRGIASLGR